MKTKRKMWGGFVNGKLHTWTEPWNAALGEREYTHTRVAIFTVLEHAKREYADVRPIVVREE